ncbi:hypothetical protein D3C78_619620 [compost metagenome]
MAIGPARTSASALSAAPVWLLNGVAAWAMSSRKAWPVASASEASTGVSRLPSTRPLAVTSCGKPLGPRRKLP